MSVFIYDYTAVLNVVSFGWAVRGCKQIPLSVQLSNFLFQCKHQSQKQNMMI